MEIADQNNCSVVEFLNNSSSVFIYGDNATNCTSEMTDIWDALQPVLRLLQKLQGIVYIVVFIVGLSLSLFLVTLILCRTSLRRQGAFIIPLQILLSNIGYLIVVSSTSAIAALQGDWMLGDGLCQFIGFCNQIFQPLRWLFTTILIIDRAMMINWPFKHEKYRNKLLTILSMIVITAVFLFAIILSSALPQCTGYSFITNTCYLTGNGSICDAYAFTYGSILFLIGGLLPFGICLWMFYKAKKVENQVVPAQIAEQGSAASRSSVTRKQLVTFFILFWTLLGCSLPQYISYLFTYSFALSNHLKGAIFGVFSLILTQPLYNGLFIADPVALMWNEDVKKELKNIKVTLKL